MNVSVIRELADFPDLVRQEILIHSIRVDRVPRRPDFHDTCVSRSEGNNVIGDAGMPGVLPGGGGLKG